MAHDLKQLLNNNKIQRYYAYIDFFFFLKITLEFFFFIYGRV